MKKKSEHPKYSDSQIDTCYNAFRQGNTREKVMKLMGFSITELNDCYFLGFKKYSKTNNLVIATKLKVPPPEEKQLPPKPQKFIRAKFIVSNTSPYKIARPGLGN